jgi:lipoprotein-anchoring transpeptidase ErfK/SrfK
MQTFIYEEPKFGSTKLGYLRAGAIVARDATPAGTTGCPGGWYAIKPFGYVCIGEGATLDTTGNPIVRATSHRRPDLNMPMPYRYGFIRFVAPQYLKVPTKEEQLASEMSLEQHLAYYKKKRESELADVGQGANDVPESERSAPLTRAQWSPDLKPGKQPKHAQEDDDATDDSSDEPVADAGLLDAAIADGATIVSTKKKDPSLLELFGADSATNAVPWWLEGPERAVPQLSSYVAPKYAIFAARVKRHTGLAFIDAFESGPASGNRKFAITVDLRLIPVDKLVPNVGTPWHGLDLTDDLTLPLAFSYNRESKDLKTRKPIKVYRLDGDTPVVDGEMFFRQAVGLSGKDRTIGATRYFETKAGKWLRKQDIIIARKPDTELWPTFAKGDQKWIDISVIKQTMILWVGDKPVYATLISTGQDGIGDPKTTKSTVRGTFHIRDKHVTTTMDANDVDNKFELRDVPWVQYFEAGYALHAAYWHDVYGTPRSHGCVNMAPIDARKVFLWTDPQIPPGWHGVMASETTGKGTIVYSHI